MVRETRYLIVRNLPENCTEETVVDHFQRYGKIQSVKLQASKDNEFGQTATVAFNDIKSAAKAHHAKNSLGDLTLRTDYWEGSSGTVALANVASSSSSSTSTATPGNAIRTASSSASTSRPVSTFSNWTKTSHEEDSSGTQDKGDLSLSNTTSSTAVSTVGGNLPTSSTSVLDKLSSTSFDLQRGRARERFSKKKFGQKGFEKTSGSFGRHGTTTSSRTLEALRSQSEAAVAAAAAAAAAPSSSSTPTSSTNSMMTGASGLNPIIVGGDSKDLNKDATSIKEPRSQPRSVASPSSRHSSGQVKPSMSRSVSRSRSRSRGSRSSSSRSDSTGTSRSTSPHRNYSSVGARPQSMVGASRLVSMEVKEAKRDEEDGERRPLGICVTGLPMRSTDSSLRDGLYHEYKKHGKVTFVQVIGEGESRCAVVSFRKPEDASKALEASQGKTFFGAKIKVSTHEGVEVDDNDPRMNDNDSMDEYHLKSTRTLFVGNLTKETTIMELVEKFKPYGEIIDVDIKRQGATTAFAFVQYVDIVSVVNALKAMEGEHIGTNKIKLGFGKSMPTTCVWVDNLSGDTTSRSLKGWFQRYGDINSCHVDRDRNKGLVYFDSYEDAQHCVSDIKMRPHIMKKKLQVDFASRECQADFLDKMEESGQLRSSQRPDERGLLKFRQQRSFDSFPEDGSPTGYVYGSRNQNYNARNGRTPTTTATTTSSTFRRSSGGVRQFEYTEENASYTSTSTSRRTSRRTEEFNQSSSFYNAKGSGDDYDQVLRDYGHSQRERRERDHSPHHSVVRRDDSRRSSRDQSLDRYDERSKDRQVDLYNSRDTSPSSEHNSFRSDSRFRSSRDKYSTSRDRYEDKSDKDIPSSPVYINHGHDSDLHRRRSRSQTPPSLTQEDNRLYFLEDYKRSAGDGDYDSFSSLQKRRDIEDSTKLKPWSIKLGAEVAKTAEKSRKRTHEESGLSDSCKLDVKMLKKLEKSPKMRLIYEQLNLKGSRPLKGSPISPGSHGDSENGSVSEGDLHHLHQEKQQLLLELQELHEEGTGTSDTESPRSAKVKSVAVKEALCFSGRNPADKRREERSRKVELNHKQNDKRNNVTKSDRLTLNDEMGSSREDKSPVEDREENSDLEFDSNSKQVKRRRIELRESKRNFLSSLDGSDNEDFESNSMKNLSDRGVCDSAESRSVATKLFDKDSDKLLESLSCDTRDLSKDRLSDRDLPVIKHHRSSSKLHTSHYHSFRGQDSPVGQFSPTVSEDNTQDSITSETSFTEKSSSIKHRSPSPWRQCSPSNSPTDKENNSGSELNFYKDYIPEPLPEEVLSDDELSDPSHPSGEPSWEERIRAIDEILNMTSSSKSSDTCLLSSSLSSKDVANNNENSTLSYSKYRIRKRDNNLPTGNEGLAVEKKPEPSVIMQQVLAKKSILDQDYRRLEQMNEKYDPKGLPHKEKDLDTSCVKVESNSKVVDLKSEESGLQSVVLSSSLSSLLSSQTSSLSQPVTMSPSMLQPTITTISAGSYQTTLTTSNVYTSVVVSSMCSSSTVSADLAIKSEEGLLNSLSKTIGAKDSLNTSVVSAVLSSKHCPSSLSSTSSLSTVLCSKSLTDSSISNTSSMSSSHTTCLPTSPLLSSSISCSSSTHKSSTISSLSLPMSLQPSQPSSSTSKLTPSLSSSSSRYLSLSASKYNLSPRHHLPSLTTTPSSPVPSTLQPPSLPVNDQPTGTSAATPFTQGPDSKSQLTPTPGQEAPHLHLPSFMPEKFRSGHGSPRVSGFDLDQDDMPKLTNSKMDEDLGQIEPDVVKKEDNDVSDDSDVVKKSAFCKEGILEPEIESPVSEKSETSSTVSLSTLDTKSQGKAPHLLAPLSVNVESSNTASSPSPGMSKCKEDISPLDVDVFKLEPFSTKDLSKGERIGELNIKENGPLLGGMECQTVMSVTSKGNLDKNDFSSLDDPSIFQKEKDNISCPTSIPNLSDTCSKIVSKPNVTASSMTSSTSSAPNASSSSYSLSSTSTTVTTSTTPSSSSHKLKVDNDKEKKSSSKASSYHSKMSTSNKAEPLFAPDVKLDQNQKHQSNNSLNKDKSSSSNNLKASSSTSEKKSPKLTSKENHEKNKDTESDKSDKPDKKSDTNNSDKNRHDSASRNKDADKSKVKDKRDPGKEDGKSKQKEKEDGKNERSGNDRKGEKKKEEKKSEKKPLSKDVKPNPETAKKDKLSKMKEKAKESSKDKKLIPNMSCISKHSDSPIKQDSSKSSGRSESRESKFKVETSAKDSTTKGDKDSGSNKTSGDVKSGTKTEGKSKSDSKSSKTPTEGKEETKDNASSSVSKKPTNDTSKSKGDKESGSKSSHKHPDKNQKQKQKEEERLKVKEEKEKQKEKEERERKEKEREREEREKQKEKERQEKDEQERKEKEERERLKREKEEKEKKEREERLKKEKEEKERKEKEEKLKREKEEKERKEREERLKREREERERKEKEEKERLRKEKEERERQKEKEREEKEKEKQRLKEEKEKKEREEKEREKQKLKEKEKKEKERKEKERKEKERKEKERKEKEKKLKEEKAKKEKEEKLKKEKEERKEKEKEERKEKEKEERKEKEKEERKEKEKEERKEKEKEERKEKEEKKEKEVKKEKEGKKEKEEKSNKEKSDKGDKPSKEKEKKEKNKEKEEPKPPPKKPKRNELAALLESNDAFMKVPFTSMYDRVKTQRNRKPETPTKEEKTPKSSFDKFKQKRQKKGSKVKSSLYSYGSTSEQSEDDEDDDDNDNDDDLSDLSESESSQKEEQPVPVKESKPKTKQIKKRPHFSSTSSSCDDDDDALLRATKPKGKKTDKFSEIFSSESENENFHSPNKSKSAKSKSKPAVKRRKTREDSLDSSASHDDFIKPGKKSASQIYSLSSLTETSQDDEMELSDGEGSPKSMKVKKKKKKMKLSSVEQRDSSVESVSKKGGKADRDSSTERATKKPSATKEKEEPKKWNKLDMDNISLKNEPVKSKEEKKKKKDQVKEKDDVKKSDVKPVEEKSIKVAKGDVTDDLKKKDLDEKKKKKKKKFDPKEEEERVNSLINKIYDKKLDKEEKAKKKAKLLFDSESDVPTSEKSIDLSDHMPHETKTPAKETLHETKTPTKEKTPKENTVKKEEAAPELKTTPKEKSVKETPMKKEEPSLEAVKANKEKKETKASKHLTSPKVISPEHVKKEKEMEKKNKEDMEKKNKEDMEKKKEQQKKKAESKVDVKEVTQEAESMNEGGDYKPPKKKKKKRAESGDQEKLSKSLSQEKKEPESPLLPSEERKKEERQSMSGGGGHQEKVVDEFISFWGHPKPVLIPKRLKDSKKPEDDEKSKKDPKDDKSEDDDTKVKEEIKEKGESDSKEKKSEESKLEKSSSLDLASESLTTPKTEPDSPEEIVVPISEAETTVITEIGPPSSDSENLVIQEDNSDDPPATPNETNETGIGLSVEIDDDDYPSLVIDEVADMTSDKKKTNKMKKDKKLLKKQQEKEINDRMNEVIDKVARSGPSEDSDKDSPLTIESTDNDKEVLLSDVISQLNYGSKSDRSERKSSVVSDIIFQDKEDKKSNKQSEKIAMRGKDKKDDKTPLGKKDQDKKKNEVKTFDLQDEELKKRDEDILKSLAALCDPNMGKQAVIEEIPPKPSEEEIKKREEETKKKAEEEKRLAEEAEKLRKEKEEQAMREASDEAARAVESLLEFQGGYDTEPMGVGEPELPPLYIEPADKEPTLEVTKSDPDTISVLSTSTSLPEKTTISLDDKLPPFQDKSLDDCSDSGDKMDPFTMLPLPPTPTEINSVAASVFQSSQRSSTTLVKEKTPEPSALPHIPQAMQCPQIPVQSPQKTISSPQMTMPTSISIPTSMQSPQRQIQSPQRQNQSPQRQLQSPQCMQSPQRQMQSPQRQMQSPQRQMQSPQRQMPSPQRSLQSPQRPMVSPQLPLHSPSPNMQPSQRNPFFNKEVKPDRNFLSPKRDIPFSPPDHPPLETNASMQSQRRGSAGYPGAPQAPMLDMKEPMYQRRKSQELPPDPIFAGPRRNTISIPDTIANLDMKFHPRQNVGPGNAREGPMTNQSSLPAPVSISLDNHQPAKPPMEKNFQAPMRNLTIPHQENLLSPRQKSPGNALPPFKNNGPHEILRPMGKEPMFPAPKGPFSDQRLPQPRANASDHPFIPGKGPIHGDSPFPLKNQDHQNLKQPPPGVKGLHGNSPFAPQDTVHLLGKLPHETVFKPGKGQQEQIIQMAKGIPPPPMSEPGFAQGKPVPQPLHDNMYPPSQTPTPPVVDFLLNSPPPRTTPFFPYTPSSEPMKTPASKLPEGIEPPQSRDMLFNTTDQRPSRFMDVNPPMTRPRFPPSFYKEPIPKPYQDAVPSLPPPPPQQQQQHQLQQHQLQQRQQQLQQQQQQQSNVSSPLEDDKKGGAAKKRKRNKKSTKEDREAALAAQQAIEQSVQKNVESIHKALNAHHQRAAAEKAGLAGSGDKKVIDAYDFDAQASQEIENLESHQLTIEPETRGTRSTRGGERGRGRGGRGRGRRGRGGMMGPDNHESMMPVGGHQGMLAQLQHQQPPQSQQPPPPFHHQLHSPGLSAHPISAQPPASKQPPFPPSIHPPTSLTSSLPHPSIPMSQSTPVSPPHPVSHSTPSVPPLHPTSIPHSVPSLHHPSISSHPHPPPPPMNTMYPSPHPPPHSDMNRPNTSTEWPPKPYNPTQPEAVLQPNKPQPFKSSDVLSPESKTDLDSSYGEAELVINLDDQPPSIEGKENQCSVNSDGDDQNGSVTSPATPTNKSQRSTRPRKKTDYKAIASGQPPLPQRSSRSGGSPRGRPVEAQSPKSGSSPRNRSAESVGSSPVVKLEKLEVQTRARRTREMTKKEEMGEEFTPVTNNTEDWKSSKTNMEDMKLSTKENIYEFEEDNEQDAKLEPNILRLTRDKKKRIVDSFTSDTSFTKPSSQPAQPSVIDLMPGSPESSNSSSLGPSSDSKKTPDSQLSDPPSVNEESRPSLSNVDAVIDAVSKGILGPSDDSSSTTSEPTPEPTGTTTRSSRRLSEAAKKNATVEEQSSTEVSKPETRSSGKKGPTVPPLRIKVDKNDEKLYVIEPSRHGDGNASEQQQQIQQPEKSSLSFTVKLSDTGTATIKPSSAGSGKTPTSAGANLEKEDETSDKGRNAKQSQHLGMFSGLPQSESESTKTGGLPQNSAAAPVRKLSTDRRNDEASSKGEMNSNTSNNRVSESNPVPPVPALVQTSMATTSSIASSTAGMSKAQAGLTSTTTNAMKPMKHMWDQRMQQDVLAGRGPMSPGNVPLHLQKGGPVGGPMVSQASPRPQSAHQEMVGKRPPSGHQEPQGKRPPSAHNPMVSHPPTKTGGKHGAIEVNPEMASKMAAEAQKHHQTHFGFPHVLPVHTGQRPFLLPPDHPMHFPPGFKPGPDGHSAKASPIPPNQPHKMGMEVRSRTPPVTSGGMLYSGVVSGQPISLSPKSSSPEGQTIERLPNPLRQSEPTQSPSPLGLRMPGAHPPDPSGRAMKDDMVMHFLHQQVHQQQLLLARSSVAQDNNRSAAEVARMRNMMNPNEIAMAHESGQTGGQPLNLSDTDPRGLPDPSRGTPKSLPSAPPSPFPMSYLDRKPEGGGRLPAVVSSAFMQPSPGGHHEGLPAHMYPPPPELSIPGLGSHSPFGIVGRYPMDPHGVYGPSQQPPPHLLAGREGVLTSPFPQGFPPGARFPGMEQLADKKEGGHPDQPPSRDMLGALSPSPGSRQLQADLMRQQPPSRMLGDLTTRDGPVGILQRYPVMWQGALALKNDNSYVQMHFISGNRRLPKQALPQPMANGALPPLRISQRMRLEQAQLEGVAKRMQCEDDYCILIAVACGRDQEDINHQTRALNEGFITYLLSKQAAGIVNVPLPGSEQAGFVVHIFPPCEFVDNSVATHGSPALMEQMREVPHAVIIIATT